MDLRVYTQDGSDAGPLALPKAFDVPWNANLVYQVVTSERANRRPRIAQAKGRGEVRGGGRKPWRQKGTGRARHGSIRSPLWAGGGVSHGPVSERQFQKKVNRKMAKRALAAILGAKARDHELLVLDDVSLSAPKTKLASDVFRRIAAAAGAADLIRGARRALLVMPGTRADVSRASRNLPFIEVIEARNITALDAVNVKYLIMPRASVAALADRLGNGS